MIHDTDKELENSIKHAARKTRISSSVSTGSGSCITRRVEEDKMPEKLKEIAHIRSMLAEDGNDDEINGKVEGIIRNGEPYYDDHPAVRGWFVDGLAVRFKAKDYLHDRNALRDIEDGGWLLQVHEFACGGFEVYLFDPDETSKEIISPRMPTFERAHLDAILQTWAWRIENA